MTLAKDEDIEIMMDATYQKIQNWFKDIKDELKTEKKRRLAEMKKFKKENPNVQHKVKIDQQVIFIAFSGHGTANSEGLNNNTMQTQLVTASSQVG